MKKIILILLLIILALSWVWWTFYVIELSENLPSKITEKDNQLQELNILRYDNKNETSICQANNQEFSKSIVSLTFDDGWREIYQNAIPIMNKAGIKSTQYVSTRVIDENEEKYVNVGHILDMARAGHEIASHAVDHARFTDIDPSQIGFQLSESKKYLMNIGAGKIDTFAYPYGEYTDNSILLSKLSYKAVRTSIPGTNDRKTDRYLLYANQIQNWMTFNPYMKRMVDRANAENKWLIFIFHQVADPTYQFYTSPKDLILLINYLIEKKIPVMTVRDVIEKCYTN